MTFLLNILSDSAGEPVLWFGLLFAAGYALVEWADRRRWREEQRRGFSVERRAK